MIDPDRMRRLWVEKLTLTDFRNYAQATLFCGPDPVVLAGPNGTGKTNCLEALSLLASGRGLRGTPFAGLVRQGGQGGWAIAAQLHDGEAERQVGTGVVAGAGFATPSARTARIVKVDGEAARGTSALAFVRMLWLTPSMDGLFTGPASDRRRFLDRFVLSLDPGYAKPAAALDRALRQRNKALEIGSPAALLDGIEDQVARAGVAVAFARTAAIARLTADIGADESHATGFVFPWASVSLIGDLETETRSLAALEIEAGYRMRLAHSRERDRAAGRTLIGPHRSDLSVYHGPKRVPAHQCSTGEQKALLIGLVLVQARLIREENSGVSPIVLFDEVAAHLDIDRRYALFEAIAALEAQVWMTGTDTETFSPLLAAGAQLFLVSNGGFASPNDAESS